MNILWKKMCYPGLDLGAIYPVEKEWNGFLFITDEFGRQRTIHTRYNGILFEVK